MKNNKGKIKLRLRDWTTGIREEEINFEKLCKMPKHNIIKLDDKIPMVNGYYIISGKSSFIDLSLYANDPNRYHNDLMVLAKDIQYIVTHKDWEDVYIEYVYTNSKKIHKMSQIHFVINMILWKGFFILGIPITKERTFMPKTFTNSAYQSFLNDKLISPFKNMTTHNQMSKILASMYDDCISICEDCGDFLGLSFSLHDIISRWNENDELRDICHTKLNKNMQVADVENFLASQAERMKNLFIEDENLQDSSLVPMLKAGVLNSKQLREFAINIGLKPDLKGKTIPIYSNTNFLTDGIRDLKSFTLDAYGGRKASVLNLAVASGGYFSRLAVKLDANITLNPDPDYDCHSENYYEMKIEDSSDLEKMNGRWYLTDNNTLRQLISTDYDKIGETLKFRTPATCASKNGICKICYGHLYNENYGLSVGALASLKIGGYAHYSSNIITNYL